MRITIGDPKTKRFSKMIEVFVIDASRENDKVIYIQDPWGSFITLTFPSHEALVAALQDLRNVGSATAYCDYQYYNESHTYEYDECDRELDPYFDIDEIFERS